MGDIFLRTSTSAQRRCLWTQACRSTITYETHKRLSEVTHSTLALTNYPKLTWWRMSTFDVCTHLHAPCRRWDNTVSDTRSRGARFKTTIYWTFEPWTISITPHCLSFGKDTDSLWSILCGALPAEVKDPTQENEKKLPWTQKVYRRTVWNKPSVLLLGHWTCRKRNKQKSKQTNKS